MQLRNILLALTLSAVVAAPAAAVTFEFLPLPTNGLGGIDLTYDGSRGAANFGGQIYLFDAAGNFTLVTTLGPGSAGKTSISADGRTIVTNTLDESATLC